MTDNLSDKSKQLVSEARSSGSYTEEDLRALVLSLASALEEATTANVAGDHTEEARESLPTIEELHARYPEVAPFVERMLIELWANRIKGDQAAWRTWSLRVAWQEISWHTGKMTIAIKNKDWELVRELAADIANGALMLDDLVEQKLAAGQAEQN